MPRNKTKRVYEEDIVCDDDAGDSKAVADAIIVRMLTKFDVLIESSRDGSPIAVFPGIQAQTRNEAINKAKQMLTFSAERAL